MRLRNADCHADNSISTCSPTIFAHPGLVFSFLTHHDLAHHEYSWDEVTKVRRSKARLRSADDTISTCSVTIYAHPGLVFGLLTHRDPAHCEQSMIGLCSLPKNALKRGSEQLSYCFKSLMDLLSFFILCFYCISRFSVTWLHVHTRLLPPESCMSVFLCEWTVLVINIHIIWNDTPELFLPVMFVLCPSIHLCQSCKCITKVCCAWKVHHVSPSFIDWASPPAGPCPSVPR